MRRFREGGKGNDTASECAISGRWTSARHTQLWATYWQRRTLAESKQHITRHVSRLPLDRQSAQQRVDHNLLKHVALVLPPRIVNRHVSLAASYKTLKLSTRSIKGRLKSKFDNSTNYLRSSVSIFAVNINASYRAPRVLRDFPIPLSAAVQASPVRESRIMASHQSSNRPWLAYMPAFCRPRQQSGNAKLERLVFLIPLWSTVFQGRLERHSGLYAPLLLANLAYSRLRSCLDGRIVKPTDSLGLQRASHLMKKS